MSEQVGGGGSAWAAPEAASSNATIPAAHSILETHRAEVERTLAVLLLVMNPPYRSP